MKCIADVQPEIVRWLWNGRIPLGKLSLLDGDPGDGKSLQTIDIAARLSRGECMPDGSASIPGGTVFVCVEDGVEDTIRPRLEAAGADLQKITDMRLVLAKDEVFDISPANIRELESAIQRFGAVLVVIDPGPAFLPKGTDANDGVDVRKVLNLLTEVAQRLQVAIVIIRHLNKDESLKAMYRGAGSMGWVGTARSAMMVEPDTEQEGCFILRVYKANLSAKPPALRYRIEEIEGIPRIQWLGEASPKISDVQAKKGKAVREAELFLTGALIWGPRPSSEIDMAAKLAGISQSSLVRAKKNLKVNAKQVSKQWFCSLPQIVRMSDSQQVADDVSFPFGKHADVIPQ